MGKRSEENGFDAAAGATVLAADDNPDNLGLLDAVLSEAGYRVRVARDGVQALASARAEAPDLVLLDAHMPGKDGYETCRELKADPLLSDVPVLFVSALTDAFNKKQAFALGAFDYLEKPFKTEDLLQRLRNALELAHYKRRCAELERRASNGHAR